METKNLRDDCYEIRPVARIRSDFKEKFGIPRQSGLIPELEARVVFEPDFRNPDALKGIEDFSYLWLVWGFSENRMDISGEHPKWNATVRPPRLGGSVVKGVFATRSPYRPNSLGLSSVKLLRLELTENEGPVLVVGGADLLDGTPIYDIKPYVAYADSHPETQSGFAVSRERFLEVRIPESELKKVPEEKKKALEKVLAQDPRGAYEKQPGYIYGLHFSDFDVHFKIEKNVLCVTEIVPAGGKNVK